MPVELPGGVRVPARAGRYRVVPSPDLNDMNKVELFILEYEYPNVIVRDRAIPGDAGVEHDDVVGQAAIWRGDHRHVGGFVSTHTSGYHFYAPSSSRPTSKPLLCQFVADLSYIDRATWNALSPEDKDTAYTPCVPSVVIEIVLETYRIEDVQAKVSKFVHAGTREGVVVDTWHDCVWIYNGVQQPYFASLAPLEFDTWPGFTLDNERDARPATLPLSFCKLVESTLRTAASKMESVTMRSVPTKMS